MLESARKLIVALPRIPAHLLLSVGTVVSFTWLLLSDQIHPILVYVLQVYLTF